MHISGNMMFLHWHDDRQNSMVHVQYVYKQQYIKTFQKVHEKIVDTQANQCKAFTAFLGKFLFMKDLFLDQKSSC